MKRLISAAFAAALTSTALFAFAAPASAATAVCAGTGTAATGAGLSYPIGARVDTSFSFSLGTGVGGCVPGGGLSASGSLRGWCGHSTGTGTLNGASFSYLSAGSILVVTIGAQVAATDVPVLGTTVRVHAGGGAGLANAVPIPVVSGTTITNSCSSGTATSFQVTGVVATV